MARVVIDRCPQPRSIANVAGFLATHAEPEQKMSSVNLLPVDQFPTRSAQSSRTYLPVDLRGTSSMESPAHGEAHAV